MATIRLSGVDGTGKSTVAAALRQRLESRGETAVVRHWPSDSLLGLFPDGSGRGRATALEPSADGTCHGRRVDRAVDAAVTLLFTGKLLLVVANALWMALVLTLRYRNAEYVILDRCALDDLVQLEYRGVSPGLVRLCSGVVTTAGLYWLDVDPELAAERDRRSSGPAHSEAYYDRKDRLYRAYVGRCGGSRLDATDDPDALVESILELRADGRTT